MEKNNVKSLNQEQEIKKYLQEMSNKNIEEVFLEVDSSEEGLEENEVSLRLDYYGLNEVVYEKKKPWYVYLLKSFLDPFILILLFIVFISYFTDIAFAPAEEASYITIIIISILITISVVLRFTQEYKSQITADNLKDLVPTTTSIERKGYNPTEINMLNVVPGDIIHLAVGDLIPVDMRIISSIDFFIS